MAVDASNRVPERLKGNADFPIRFGGRTAFDANFDPATGAGENRRLQDQRDAAPYPAARW